MAADENPEAARRRALEDFAARASKPSLAEIVDDSAARVIAAFGEAGIPFLVLKGPALASLLYRPDETRPYLDIDLLVPPGARAAAGETLSRMGFRNRADATGAEEFTGALHAETWDHAEAMPVDLHWRLTGCQAPADEAWTRLYEGNQPVMVGNREARTLRRAGLALHLATHAADQGASDRKAIGDLERGVARWPLSDWEEARELAEAVEATEAFAVGLRLCPQGVQIARALDLPEAAELAWALENRRVRPRGTFHLGALRRARHPREVVHVLRRSLFPNRTWMVREYPSAGRSRLSLATAYARHLARAPGWAFQAWSFRRRAKRAAR